VLSKKSFENQVGPESQAAFLCRQKGVRKEILETLLHQRNWVFSAKTC